MPVYIYSMPKAGTYFFATFLKELGFHDTGYHIERNEYLDTHAHSMEVNARTPGKARVPGFFVAVMRRLRADDVAFGHFPLPIHHAVLDELGRYVCAYRDPRRTLVSEFIDFRYRRTGVKWLLPDAVPDDGAAFALYLERHGLRGHLGVFRDMVLLRSILASPLAPPVLGPRTIFVNFDAIRSDAAAALPVARFLGSQLTDDEVRAALASALAAETKTKATEITLDREALWTDAAEALYAGSQFPMIKSMAEDLGMVF